MIRLALRSLAARPLRTALTALAVVLGVAMVSAAFTITDTMRGAADSLSRAAYDGTDAVVGARTAFDVDAGDWTAKRPTVDAGLLDRVRAVPGVAVAAADITDEAKVIGRDGKPIGDGPYFGVGLDARTPGADALTPFRLSAGRWAGGPGEVVIDTGMAADEDRPVGSTVTITTRGEPHDFRVVGTAQLRQRAVDGHRDVRRLRPRRRARRCSAAATGRRDPRRRARRRRAGAAARGPGRALPPASVTTAADAGPLHPRRAGAVHLDHPDRAAGVRRRRRPGRRVHDLQHALDHRRPADPGHTLLGNPRRAHARERPTAEHRSSNGREEQRALGQKLPGRDQDVGGSEIREHHPEHRDHRTAITRPCDSPGGADHCGDGHRRGNRDRARSLMRDHGGGSVVHRESRRQEQQMRDERPRRGHRPPSLHDRCAIEPHRERGVWRCKSAEHCTPCRQHEREHDAVRHPRAPRPRE